MYHVKCKYHVLIISCCRNCCSYMLNKKAFKFKRFSDLPCVDLILIIMNVKLKWGMRRKGFIFRDALKVRTVDYKL